VWYKRSLSSILRERASEGLQNAPIQLFRSGWDMMPSSSIDKGTIVELRVKYVNVAYGRRCNNLLKNLTLLNFGDERKPNLKMPSMLNVVEYGTHYGLNGNSAKRLKCQKSIGHCNRHALPYSRRVYVRPHMLMISSVASGQVTRVPSDQQAGPSHITGP